MYNIQDSKSLIEESVCVHRHTCVCVLTRWYNNSAYARGK